MRQVAGLIAAVVGSLQEVARRLVEHCSEVHPSEKSWAVNLEALLVVADILA